MAVGNSRNVVSIDRLSTLVTGRNVEQFTNDLVRYHGEIAARIAGRRVLVIGGAGSIGAATIRAIIPFRPHALHVIDQSENNLAELVRDIRSGTTTFDIPDFRTLPLDYGSPIMAAFLRNNDPYDLILNFAAIKHVRSEKDIYSVLQMLDTNVVKQARFLGWLAETQGNARYFSVSTDKAANPVNLMGASKRMMEHVLFSDEIAPGCPLQITSARFANVAFSDGSLLDSFLRRLQKRQPLAVPAETKRYFISLKEAGQICLLASVCAPHRSTLIPCLDPETDLVDLESIAVAVLREHGFDPRRYACEEKAKASMESDLGENRYPLLVTPLDTSGEKPYEEFVGDGETAIDVGMSSLMAVAYEPASGTGSVSFVKRVEALLSSFDRTVTKDDIVEWLFELIPQLHHHETGKNLDQRM